MHNLDPNKTEEVRDFLVGTSNTEWGAAEALGIPEDMMLDYIIAAEVESCAICGWWYDKDEMHEHDSELICEDCNENNNQD